MDRWGRVERYARWRSKLRWGDLPDDIVTSIVTHLDDTDVDTLARALVGDPLERWAAIRPRTLQTAWLQGELYRFFASFVYGDLADEVLHDTRSPFASTAMVLDWSCFSPVSANVVAEFSWRQKRAHVEIHRDRLMWELWRHVWDGLPVARATLHRVLNFNGESVLNPSPTRVVECLLVPPTLVRLVSGPHTATRLSLDGRGWGGREGRERGCAH